VDIQNDDEKDEAALVPDWRFCLHLGISSTGVSTTAREWTGYCGIRNPC
jgi:hypothetical protein